MKHGGRFRSLTGVGGIGSGMVFQLLGNHTLGRNESRLGRLMPFADYCKLHIIAHYAAVLTGADTGGLPVRAVGRVGDDEAGVRLVKEMAAAGIDTEGVRVVPGKSTLFSVCFQYPDDTGGNITTAESACGSLTPEDIDSYFQNRPDPGGELFLSAPEVSVDTRLSLLRWGRKRGAFNAASVLSGEVAEFREKGGFRLVDLLSVNIDEAAAIARADGENLSSDGIAARCAEALKSFNPSMKIAVTDGPNGSCGFEGDVCARVPVLPVTVKGTAGAGDAFMAGLLVGLHYGMPFVNTGEAGFFEKRVGTAMDVAGLLSSFAVTSPDAIHRGINCGGLSDFAALHGLTPPAFLQGE